MGDDFPVMIRLPTGECRTCLSEKDLIELVTETGGSELADCIRKLLYTLSDENEYLEGEMKDLTTEIHEMWEEKKRFLLLLLSEAEKAHADEIIKMIREEEF